MPTEPSRLLSLATYAPAADGVTDDTPALQRCFSDAGKLGGALVVIPPGAYFLPGETPIPLASHLTVQCAWRKAVRRRTASTTLGWPKYAAVSRAA